MSETTIYDANGISAVVNGISSDEDGKYIIPSSEDRDFLKAIGQRKSVIISWYTGRQLEFYADEFKETEHGYD